MNDAERKDVRARYRAYLLRYTRTGKEMGRGSDEDRLKQIDPKLSLRFDYLTEKWGVYYEHKGRINCIRVVKYGEPWDKILREIEKNGSTTKQDLINLHQIHQSKQEKQVMGKMQDASEEYAKTMEKASRNKVTMTV